MLFYTACLGSKNFVIVVCFIFLFTYLLCKSYSRYNKTVMTLYCRREHVCIVIVETIQATATPTCFYDDDEGDDDDGHC